MKHAPVGDVGPVDSMATWYLRLENDRLVWIDCEMTGLDLAVDELVEIAVVVTDFELNPIDPGFQVVIRPNESALEHMNDFVTKMHETSGLIEEIAGGVSLEEAESQTLAYIKRFVPLEQKRLWPGITIGTDRMFLAKYMPQVDQWLHYRNVDVSSIKELSRRWYPRVFFQAPSKDGGHRAPSPTISSRSGSSGTTAKQCSSMSRGPPATRAREIASRTVSEFTPNM